ncbi:hypothetical protein K474DRAFT_1661344 [Panus rudis PR-1116 ss-1]|nr:hypothetical protein K474DRAFT_1661344 [Panus rudis PR-1116 ss-1]
MLERNYAVCDDTYGTRLNRVLVWRENFAKAMGLLPDDHRQSTFVLCPRVRADLRVQSICCMRHIL